MGDCSIYKFKFVLAGDKNVGKTSLLLRFCDNTFSEDLKGTIGVDFKKKKIELNYDSSLIPITLSIWDFAGEEKFRTLFPPYIQGANAALILFDVTNKESLYGLENWVKIIDENAGDNVAKSFIATKIDLKDKQEVAIEEANEFCKKHNMNKDVFITSSKTGENVTEAFLNLAKEVVDTILQKCKECGEYFSKELKKCTGCGKKIEFTE
jgi:small GTP-binding protein